MRPGVLGRGRGKKGAEKETVQKESPQLECCSRAASLSELDTRTQWGREEWLAHSCRLRQPSIQVLFRVPIVPYDPPNLHVVLCYSTVRAIDKDGGRETQEYTRYCSFLLQTRGKSTPGGIQRQKPIPCLTLCLKSNIPVDTPDTHCPAC